MSTETRRPCSRDAAVLMALMLILQGACHCAPADNEWEYVSSSNSSSQSAVRISQQWVKRSNFYCDGSAQSPIDIITKDSVFDARLQPVSFTIIKVGTRTQKNLLDVSLNFQLVNDGHKVSLNPISAEEEIQMQFGKRGNFILAGLHFHWGVDDDKGSEHTLDGKSFPMEIHFVTYNRDKFRTLADAAAAPGGLAVLGVFVKVDQNTTGTVVENRAIQKITDKFSGLFLKAEGKAARQEPVSGLVLNDLLPVDSFSDYYRYMGSLTTPSCSENVLWTVLVRPITISAVQLKKFRRLRYRGQLGAMVDNYRLAQPLNPAGGVYIYHRVVSRAFKSAATLRASPPKYWWTLFILLPLRLSGAAF